MNNNILRKAGKVLLFTISFVSVFSNSVVNAAEIDTYEEMGGEIIQIEEVDTGLKDNMLINENSQILEEEYKEIYFDNSISENTYENYATYSHNSADTALFLDSSYMGNVLADAANSLENWYYFQLNDTNKISVVLEPPTNSDYDLYLYQYNSDGTLTLISYSINSGYVMENLSAVGSQGYYFLRVVPINASITEGDAYNFIINPISSYDDNEPDDMYVFASEYENTININGTLDNAFDQDWTKLKINTAYSKYLISLANVPENANYAVYVYDSSLGFIGGFECSSSEVREVTLTYGSYYICVASVSGYSDSVKYNLKVMERGTEDSIMISTKTGQIVELTSTELFINGNKVDMNWEYKYDVNYVRNQNVITSSGTVLNTSYLLNGVFRGPQSVSSDDCIAVKMKNFKYKYFATGTPDGTNGLYTLDIDLDAIFYVDVISGKVIDTNINYYYTHYGMPQTFTEFK